MINEISIGDSNMSIHHERIKKAAGNRLDLTGNINCCSDGKASKKVKNEDVKDELISMFSDETFRSELSRVLSESIYSTGGI